jgi:Ni,Fe-hydrogenase III large subunit
MTTQPPSLAHTLSLGGPPSGPWPRRTVGRDIWQSLCDGLSDERWGLLDLWGEPGAVHMALWDAANAMGGIAHFAGDGLDYPAVSRTFAPALRLERALRDLYGLRPLGLPDERPWIDHGRWDSQPPGYRPMVTSAERYAFLPVDGAELHEIAVGPVHAGIIEPGHFRFTANGETVVRLEQRLGYAHKGTESLMAGRHPDHAARLAGRMSGDSTVAYAFAFARAVEAALGAVVPSRAQWLRALMAELERLANHLGDIGAVCNDASFSLMHAHCAILRETVLRISAICFGHRLMMDRIVPGGVTLDLAPDRLPRIHDLLAEIRARFPELVELYDNTASLQDRTVGTGIVQPELARQFGAGGFVGRASGRVVDARRMPGYAPYDQLQFEVPTHAEGDVNARVWIRIREVEQSLSLVEQILRNLPEGPVFAPLPPPDGETAESAALVESFRGDIFAWVRLGPGGTVERCRMRDPSWFQWPLLEAAIEGNIVADFPLCNKSFNCSYSGHDL